MLQRGNRIVAQDVITRIDEALSALDTGAICLFAGMSTPTGFLDCYGGEVSRITYGNLFAVIGTTWGAGDGSTTFTLPNFVDRYPIGYGSNGVGYLTGQTLPNITGFFGATDIIGSVSGAFYTRTLSQTRGDYKSASTNKNYNFGFDASRSNGIYGASAGSLGTGRVIPYSSTVRFLIKY